MEQQRPGGRQQIEDERDEKGDIDGIGRGGQQLQEADHVKLEMVLGRSEIKKFVDREKDHKMGAGRQEGLGKEEEVNDEKDEHGQIETGPDPTVEAEDLSLKNEHDADRHRRERRQPEQIGKLVRQD